MYHEISQGFRLSPQQKHLWLLQQRRSGLPYRALCALAISGSLDVQRLKQAVAQVVAEHEILRTRFAIVPGMTLALQAVDDQGTAVFHERDLSDLAPQEQTANWQAWFDQMLVAPMDVASDARLRITLVTLAADRRMLLVALPALVADMLTISNLIREIAEHYTALPGERRLTEPMQYADLAEVFNQLVEAEDTETGRAYWRQQDLPALCAFQLPFGRQVAGPADFSPQMQATVVSPIVWPRLAALAAQPDASVANLLLACWLILLWRHARQSPVLAGIGYPGRTYQGLEQALGLFARYLPLRMRLTENLRLCDLLAQLADVTQEIAKWQDYFAWEHVNAAAGGQGHTPAFPICFDFVEQPADYSADDTHWAWIRQYACIDWFCLKLVCVRKSKTILLEFHYDSSAFTTIEIEYLARQFNALLASAAAAPDTPIDQLDFLDAAERRQLLVEFNTTTTAFPHDICFPQLFEAQVERTPTATALICGEQTMTFAQLNQRANQIAHYLRSMGVGPDVRVGICLERSLDMLVGLLGILKAGGAYVPLDPTYPPARLAFMVADAQAAVIIMRSRSAAALPETVEGCQCLDITAPIIDDASMANPAPVVQPEHLAYIIYTSGSTGRPKGVMIAHRGLVNYLAWSARAYTANGGHGAPVCSPLGFDLSVTSLFVPLCVGQPVLLIPDEQGLDGLSAALSNAARFSLVKLTPSHLDMLRQLWPATAAVGTSAFVIGGEALRTEQLVFWRQLAPDVRLINEYGPTETVVGCCVYELSPQPLPPSAVPIGRPIANTRLYVLNAQLRPVPIGIPGELYIGGVGLARGYLNRPDLTAERFVPNPFQTLNDKRETLNESLVTSNSAFSVQHLAFDGRLYKTGDLVRYRPDGNLEFLGRVDRQVKLRGYRIELGEIETMLDQHPGVREAVVVSREQAQGERQLIAYMLANAEPAPTASELRSFLRTKLPEYMVPTGFVFLAAWPLTPNGKLDRQALPEPKQLRAGSNQTYIAPSTEIERTIAAIWQDVLRIEQVGLHDNFFDLGGHSLLTLQVRSRLRTALSRDISMADLFSYPTLGALADYLSQGAPEPASLEEQMVQASTRSESRRQRRALRQHSQEEPPQKGSTHE